MIIGLEAIIGLAIYIVLVAILACVVGFGAFMFTCGSIVFSRLAFAMLLAVSTSLTIVGNGGFWNFIAWTVIFFGIIYLLSLFPRIGGAIRFFCTMFISVMVIYIAVSIVGSIASGDSDFTMHIVLEIIIKVICTFFSFRAMMAQTESGGLFCFNNVIIVNLERLIASVIYGIAMVICISMSQGRDIPLVVEIITLVGSTVLAFVLDIFLRGKYQRISTDESIYEFDRDEKEVPTFWDKVNERIEFENENLDY